MTITDINQLDPTKKYTYADYLTWRFKERVELIKGKLFKMSPAPNRKHQRIVMNISGLIWTFLKKHKCQVFVAPFDVRLPVPKNSDKDYTVVQPDITVVCDESKLDEQGCNGAPDLAVEVLSPGNTQKEMRDKFDIYEEAGVREYWIVDPAQEYLIIYSLNGNDQYIGSRPYGKGMSVSSQVLEGFTLDLDEIFD